MREAIAGRGHWFAEIDRDLRIMPPAGRLCHPGKVLGVVRVRKGFGLTQHTVLSQMIVCKTKPRLPLRIISTMRDRLKAGRRALTP
jgi:hypothetical protein